VTAFEIDAVRTEANEQRNTLPPFDPRLEFDADPHPVYARYRQEDPINWGLPNDPRFAGLWYLFRHEDCHNLFRIGLEDSSKSEPMVAYWICRSIWPTRPMKCVKPCRTGVIST